MDLHADAHSPTPIRRLMAKAPTNVISVAASRRSRRGRASGRWPILREAIPLR